MITRITKKWVEMDVSQFAIDICVPRKPGECGISCGFREDPRVHRSHVKATGTTLSLKATKVKPAETLRLLTPTAALRWLRELDAKGKDAVKPTHLRFEIHDRKPVKAISREQQLRKQAGRLKREAILRKAGVKVSRSHKFVPRYVGAAI